MIPLARPIITEEMRREVLEVLDSGRFVSGPRIEQFEEVFAGYCNAKKATAVSSGTAAIYLALQALGVGPGDRVACPSLSFVATASPILLLGAKPVFVDVGDDYCMDMDDLELKLGDKTKAVITVHLYGQMGDMGKLMELKRKHGFFLVEDACQAHGAEYQGKKAGSFGDIACFSFYPSKNMTVAGEGGMVVTSDKELDVKIKALRNHGIVHGKGRGEYVSELLGFNFRMSEIAAAIGIVQLKHLEDWIKRRREIADLYSRLLPPQVVGPKEYPGRKSVYCLYVIRTEKRDQLRQFLAERDIATGIHYPVPLHKQPVFATNEHLGRTEAICQQILSLPMFPQLREEEVEFVCQTINDFYQQRVG